MQFMYKFRINKYSKELSYCIIVFLHFLSDKTKYFTNRESLSSVIYLALYSSVKFSLSVYLTILSESSGRYDRRKSWHFQSYLRRHLGAYTSVAILRNHADYSAVLSFPCTNIVIH